MKEPRPGWLVRANAWAYEHPVLATAIATVTAFLIGIPLFPISQAVRLGAVVFIGSVVGLALNHWNQQRAMTHPGE